MPSRTGSSQQPFLGLQRGFLSRKESSSSPKFYDCRSNPSSNSSSSGSYKSAETSYAPYYDLFNEINRILSILKPSLSLEESKSQFEKLIQCYHALDVDVKDDYTERIKEQIKSHFCKFPNHVFHML